MTRRSVQFPIKTIKHSNPDAEFRASPIILQPQNLGRRAPPCTTVAGSALAVLVNPNTPLATEFVQHFESYINGLQTPCGDFEELGTFFTQEFRCNSLIRLI
jgi:hypothetical protein